MGRLRAKGKAGAAKAYVTRTSAIKKLQCSLADFRRLCILKGIFPREPRSRKKANKGSSAPTSFYYAKDIAYLAHEPNNKPSYRLDHIIKERYPTFIDAVRDIDDALCMVFLFASLPSNARLPASLTENCARLAAEWQLYAEVMDQTVTWLVPYQFTQNIPADVDVRVMLTFLELYQTLLGFVFFKLYTDSGLVYPPPLDVKKMKGGLVTSQAAPSVASKPKAVEIDGRKISGKDVRQAIKTMTGADADVHVRPSVRILLTTLKALEALPQSLTTSLFSPYTFYLSRETSRSVFEFIVRSFGGRIGWPASSGSSSPFDESDNSITHVIIDRPTAEERELRSRRKYVQPQWVTLPPHLSPFGEYEGTYDPTSLGNQAAEESESEDEDVILPEDEEADEEQVAEKSALRAAATANDPVSLRAAELAAEVAGVDFGTFEKEVRKSRKKSKAPAKDDMMMSNKQKKLYERMKYSEKKKASERAVLEGKKQQLQKQKKRETKAG
ncbi:Pescadillo N-terminus-domain-containing protein [Mycena galopus ATCC 62051]|nr:Pescadillo N-terminus-domain-containing protein [Mycena galopus ATCC 62051]